MLLTIGHANQQFMVMVSQVKHDKASVPCGLTDRTYHTLIGSGDCSAQANALPDSPSTKQHIISCPYSVVLSLGLASASDGVAV